MINGIVSTIPDRCKRCYSCVRECPAKAIKVINGQATVIHERCIACGHCVKVCSQNAKQILTDVNKVVSEIIPSGNAIAVVAPSFAASFPDDFNKVPTALRKLGFTKVVETAFGADLISDLYLNKFESDEKKTIISSACPAVVNLIEKYYDSLVPKIAGIVSPMVAIGRYLKSTLGEDVKIVFIGPCIAKKEEYREDEVEGVIDAVLTFSEVKDLLSGKNINLSELEKTAFDPPHAYMGKTYPLAGGLLKTADIPRDILAKEVIVVEGKQKVIEIIDEIEANQIKAKFVDILFCEGCISGPAIDSSLNYYSRREKVINFVEQNLKTTDKQIWKSNLYNSRKLDFTRSFHSKNQRKPYPSEDMIKKILAETNKFSVNDELNCGACGYATCREYAVAIAKGLAEKDMCLPYLIDQIEKAYDDLKNTQEQLRTAEKLASIGQLAAGVAHEINNPLGTIILYASMLRKDLDKAYGSSRQTEDLELVLEEANRCKNIVANLLNFARQGRLNVTRFDVSILLENILRLIKMNPAYSNISIDILNEANETIIYGDADQLRQVFVNLINNACEAIDDCEERKIKIKLYGRDDYLITEIEDTGSGIAEENFGKIFTPFFTTKKIGKGTGLGLAIAYGIVKMHRGEISFISEEGKGTTFKLRLPKKPAAQNNKYES